MRWTMVASSKGSPVEFQERGRARWAPTRACRRHTSDAGAMLRVSDLHVFHGKSHVVQGVGRAHEVSNEVHH